MSAGSRGVWVVAEADEAVPERIRLGLVAEGERLAGLMRTRCDVLLMGTPGAALDRAVIRMAVATPGALHVVRDSVLSPYEARPWVEALRMLVSGADDLVLLAATPTGRDLAPQLAVALGAGLVADCVNVEVGDDGQPIFARLVLGGRLQAALAFPAAARIVATLCPQRLPEPESERRAGAPSRVVDASPSLSPPRLRRVGIRRLAPEDVPLVEADVVVGAGRGVGGPEGVSLVRELAQCLYGAVAATRPVVDSGWLPYELQVGQTGKTVAPRIYVACGISGAIHHTMGIKDAGVVVALNTDRSAPIFRVADVGFVGDARAILPRVIAGLHARKTVRPTRLSGVAR